jgi:hypothetical protein
VLLITDALCYSATDIFAAGFQDHEIGPILGTSGNTGAGGANVWTHRLLQILMPQPDSPFKPLPYGTGMRVAVRRTLRAGERAGIPVEDLGVQPDFVHQLTNRDLMENNDDLMNRAGEILAGLPVYNLSVTIDGIDGTSLTATVTTQNISRLDALVDERPQQSLDVSDGATQLALELPSKYEILELCGYDVQGRLVAAPRIKI